MKVTSQVEVKIASVEHQLKSNPTFEDYVKQQVAIAFGKEANKEFPIIRKKKGDSYEYSFSAEVYTIGDIKKIIAFIEKQDDNEEVLSILKGNA